MKKALIVVDLQNDFLPGGALPVPEGEQVVPLVDHLLESPFDLRVATKDWHSPEHCSFASNHPGKQVGMYVKVGESDQILWPVHCVQNSPGAAFSPGWRTAKIDKIFYKGIDDAVDSYSAFFDNERRRSTGLEEYLRQQGIDTVFFAGLATEYCVKYSVMDALHLGFKVFVIQDACRGIVPEDAEDAIKEMVRAGATLTNSSVLMKKLGRF